MNTPGVNHIILTVKDLGISRTFYHDLLGFPVVDFDMEGFRAFMIPTGDLTIWFLTHDSTPPSDVFSEFRIGLDHLAFTAPSEAALHELADKLIAAGVNTKGVETFFTGNKYMAFRDPDNIQLEYWMNETGEQTEDIQITGGIIRRQELVDFLLKAKRATYAAFDGQNKVKTPALSGSKQLEYRDGPFLYRDVYFGEEFFAGQEVVYHNDVAIWTMTYAGGFVGDQTGTPEFNEVFGGALRQVAADRPYRGPNQYRVGNLEYTDYTQGDLARFSGREMITREGQPVYALRYMGGLLK
jgi:catechol 2,3-dioxygenase-like lactoylglutathione lyase family enzyme